MAEDADKNVQCEDYEYDLAHEATEGSHAKRPTPEQTQPASMHVHDDAAHDLA